MCSKQNRRINQSVFDIITWIYEPKTLTRHILCECKCEFDSQKCNLNQKWNNNKRRSECKKYHICGKDYILKDKTQAMKKQ